MTDLKNLKVGDEVPVIPFDRRKGTQTKERVTKVGRKFFHVTGRYERFYIDGCKHDAGTYSPRCRVSTPELEARMAVAEEAMERVYAFGVTHTGFVGWGPEKTIAIHNALAELMGAEKI